MSLESALALIDSVADYRVLFVGDSIQDEYHYVTTLGKSPKEYLIPVSFNEAEVFQGGTVAAANHARSFCREVDVRTCRTPVRKVRFIEKYNLRKLFEVQYDDVFVENPDLGGNHDCVVVTDFGHRRVTREMIEGLCKLPFVAVCAQTNSSNIGFNLITRYPKADYIVIDEPEARLAAQDRDGYIRNVMDKLSHNRCNKFIVTHGHFGAYGYQDGQFLHHQGFANHPLDTLGAGDAFFSVTAPMAKTGNIDDLLVIGNAAGAIKTHIVGHRESVTKEHLIEFLKAHGHDSRFAYQ
jgi:bifunctional ADP-heptose synthase (sugar kinase/adenylyltransferase)